MNMIITTDILLDCIGEIPEEFVLEAEYTEEELRRLNAPKGGIKTGSQAPTNSDESIGTFFPAQSDAEEDETEVKLVKVPKHKASAIIWISMGVVLAAAAILLFVFLWNPDRSDVVSTPEETMTDPELEKLKKAEIGDYITLGSYEQDNNVSNGPEKIEWLVLDKQEDKLLLLSKYAICRRPYNNVYEDVTWSTCTLRSWLNTEYLTQAFSEEERKRIADTHVINADNPKWGTPGGDDTTDKVFLLSLEEAGEYFTDDAARIATLTDGTSVWWWLRSPGYYSDSAAFVYNIGSVDENGSLVDNAYGPVRPAIWVDITAFE